jgi:uncharacterized protein
MKKTLILGASPNETRMSYAVVEQLSSMGHEVVAVGARDGSIGEVVIQKGTPPAEGIHTVSLYLNAKLQPPLYDYILGLRPQRIIFNPGTENRELMDLAKAEGIETKAGCTMVMLSLGNY